MTDLIRREDALDAIYGVVTTVSVCATAEEARIRTDTRKRCEDAVASVPAVDAVEAKHGRYVGTEFDGYADGYPVYYEWVCSECGCIFEDDEPTYNYCPNCGARMDGGETDA